MQKGKISRNKMKDQLQNSKKKPFLFLSPKELKSFQQNTNNFFFLLYKALRLSFSVCYLQFVLWTNKLCKEFQKYCTKSNTELSKHSTNFCSQKVLVDVQL